MPPLCLCLANFTLMPVQIIKDLFLDVFIRPKRNGHSSYFQ
jgi:hypothetical protein